MSEFFALVLAACIGTYIGEWRADAKWRAKGNDPPNGGGRMLSRGRFYWVCADDADPRARAFVAEMLGDTGRTPTPGTDGG